MKETSGPYFRSYVELSDMHKMYYQKSGNPAGQPILIIHGGPGDSLSDGLRTLFNPEKFCIIQYDQRSCGKSLPFGSLKNIETKLLIEDIEILRKHLKIKKWHIYGSSWGSTLALGFAALYQNTILSLNIQGVFFASKSEIENIYSPKGKIARLYPDIYSELAEHVKGKTTEDLISKYHSIFTSNNKENVKKALHHWLNFESKILSVDPHPPILINSSNYKELYNHCLLESFYFKNNFFIDFEKILKELQTVPIVWKCNIVHGEQDMISPVDNAIELNKRLDNTNLHIIKNAGHTSCETKISSKIKEILDAI